ncbi:MAG: carbamoyltransferase HypF [Parasporobacterium sp.]|nr:carbamoyltransferase HypF [Parasporobacterium sp.]
MDRQLLIIKVYGIVQGVGFRPTVARHAAESKITGSVCNKGPYVEIFAEGTAGQTDRFLHLLENQPPKRAAILKVDVKPLDPRRHFDTFEIIESEKTSGEIFISPDIAICDECKKEMFDPSNKRYLHPFINCTCCGPRLTILEALPYDRVRTSMKKFPMCPDCAAEYYDPKTRRYDAQPVCCPECGPQVYVLEKNGDINIKGRDAITALRKTVAGGGIAAIKGIGGFHLCCDATNPEAVERLRMLKNRPVKPFAVMMKDETVAERECELTDNLRGILTGHQKPVILLKRKKGRVADITAPGNPKLGVMLPYAPVQMLLFNYNDDVEMPDCLVMTSGNESGAPICREDEGALQSLGHLCDIIISNDRDIRVRADDTVLDTLEGKPYMIRRSRGYAPLPFMLGNKAPKPLLAIGGELKNSFTIGTGNLLYPSPYIGDLADLRAINALTDEIDLMASLLEVKPAVIAADMHPLYHSVETAEELAEKWSVPLLKIQHHYAHVLSCMAENDCRDKVIGISFDGTGYGTDGTVWGGEILVSDTKGFERRSHVTPFLQVGGDISAKEGWRIAAAMIAEYIEDPEEAAQTAMDLQLCSQAEFRVLYKMTTKNLNAVKSTSCGRIFDAVSAILGVRYRSTFEGEASTYLQFRAEEYEPDEDYRLPELQYIKDGLLNTKDLIMYIIKAAVAGEDKAKLAYIFHDALAQMVRYICIIIRDEGGPDTAALSGGVYQNTLLTKLTKDKLEKEGFKVLIHHMVPPNDGGISLGQALYAMENMED